jgi:hypothetical protein
MPMRGNHLEEIPADRWETVQGWTERIDADRLKITVVGRTAAPRSQRVGATAVVDERIQYDYRRAMRAIVRFLEQRWVV